MTLYGYARVSVREPEDKNLDLQVERLVRAGCSLGNIRAEEASGARNDRGGLLELLDLVVEGDTLVVTHIDRLSRGLTHGLQVIEGLHRAGVEFRSMSEDFDTATATGKLQLTMVLAFSEWWRVAHDSVTISWAAPGQGSVTGYRILRGTDSNSLSAIVQNTDSTATEYTDSTVAAETTYHYAVLALSAEGDGAQSAAVSATTPAAPQQATVPDLRLSSTAAGQLTISWDTPQPTPSDYRIIWAAKR